MTPEGRCPAQVRGIWPCAGKFRHKGSCTVDVVLTPAQRIAAVLSVESNRPDDWPRFLTADCRKIRDRYNELKRDLGFSEAAYIARSEWVASVMESSE